MSDIFEKTRTYTVAREAIKEGYYPYFIPLDENEGTEVIYKGHRLIMCGSNNYLGLTTHPKVREAACRALERYGTSCTGSRFLNGTLEMHEELERQLAAWVKKDAALVFSTGMQVNLGTISAIVGRGDYVILDKDDHASIVDGARLSYGKIERFQHNDVGQLEKVLQSLPESAGKLVVVDGVFSMGGDIAPLKTLLPVCSKYGARLMVDDAHGMGVLGGGRGTAEELGLTKEVDLIMSTFSKSFASLGGFIAGDDDVIHYIKHHARSLIFSASIPPANAAAALAALDVMRTEPGKCAMDTPPWVSTPVVQKLPSCRSLLGMTKKHSPSGRHCLTRVFLSILSYRRRRRPECSCYGRVIWPRTPTISLIACWTFSTRSAKNYK